MTREKALKKLKKGVKEIVFVQDQELEQELIELMDTILTAADPLQQEGTVKSLAIMDEDPAMIYRVTLEESEDLKQRFLCAWRLLLPKLFAMKIEVGGTSKLIIKQ